MYREMRAALAEFDVSCSSPTPCSQQQQQHGRRQGPPPRHKAFYQALRSVLTQVFAGAVTCTRVFAVELLSKLHSCFTASSCSCSLICIRDCLLLMLPVGTGCVV